MTAAAAATRTLKVATGVCLVPQRDPIHTAKQVATVDVLSDGRVILGVGAGWNRQEMRNHGTDPKTRMRLLTERVQAMIEIWTKDVAEYHGQLVDFDLLQAWPKPVQTPYPPIMVGGAGRTVEDRVLAFGDGWAPMIAGIEDDVFDRFARLQDRTDKPLELTASGPDPDRAHAHASAGPRCTSGAGVAPPGPRWRDQRQRHRTIPRRRRGQHHLLSEVEAIPITPSWTGSWPDPAERLAGDHQQDACQSGGRHDDEREPNGRAAQRVAQDRGNSQNQKQAGQQLPGAVPLNMSRVVAMAHTATAAPLEGAGNRQYRDGRPSAQSTDITPCQASPKQKWPPPPDRVRQLPGDQLSRAGASQRISSRSPETAGSGGAIASTLEGIRWGRGSLSVAPSSGAPTGGRRVVR